MDYIVHTLRAIQAPLTVSNIFSRPIMTKTIKNSSDKLVT